MLLRMRTVVLLEPMFACAALPFVTSSLSSFSLPSLFLTPGRMTLGGRTAFGITFLTTHFIKLPQDLTVWRQIRTREEKAVSGRWIRSSRICSSTRPSRCAGEAAAPTTAIWRLTFSVSSCSCASSSPFSLSLRLATAPRGEVLRRLLLPSAKDREAKVAEMRLFLPVDLSLALSCSPLTPERAPMNGSRSPVPKKASTSWNRWDNEIECGLF